MKNYQNTVTERFLRYVQIDTQSDPYSDTQPSTAKQMNLSKISVKELLAIDINDAHLDEFGYVYATIPSNSTKAVPTICFCSHVDTSPDLVPLLDFFRPTTQAKATHRISAVVGLFSTNNTSESNAPNLKIQNIFIVNKLNFNKLGKTS